MNMIMLAVLARLCILAVLLILTIFFTAAETSLTVLRRSQIKRLIRDKNVYGLNSWLKNPNRLLTTTLVGTAVCVVAISVLATTIALDISRRYGFPETAAASLSTVLVVILVLVFAEIVPKAFARRNAEKVSTIIINPLRFIDFILTPVAWIFTLLSDSVIRATGGSPLKEQPLFAFEEVKGLIEIGVKEGVIAKTEKKMLSQIMEFGDTVVREIMVPRISMKVLDIEKNESDLIGELISLRHSRIPVYRGNMDNIAGILYVKDLLPILAKGEKFDRDKHIRKPYFVPEAKKIGELLKEFRKGREHIAIVVDEYGVPTGLITIEDIVEEITGEIFDEYDIKKDTIVKTGEKRWVINASEDLDKINDELGTDLPEDEFDSLAGLIVGELGKVPQSGEEFSFRNYSFVILEADPNRVIKVELVIQ